MWVTPTEATQYLIEGMGGSLWAALSPTAQSQALTTSFRSLSNDPGYCFPESPTQKMKDAQCELALWLTTNPAGQQAASLIAQGVSSFRIGAFSMDFRGQGEGTFLSYPQSVADLLDEYVCEYPGLVRMKRGEL